MSIPQFPKEVFSRFNNALIFVVLFRDDGTILMEPFMLLPLIALT